MKSLRCRAVFRHIRATQTFMDPYGPQPVYALCRHIFSLFFLFFLSYFSLKGHYHSLHYWKSYDRLSPSSQHHVCLHPPYILLIVTQSPVTCKDFFSLVYMYKSSRYYTVFNIGLGSIFPQSTSLKPWTGSTAAYQAFGLYCQWLPGLTTKSIHYYLHSYYFCTRFTSTIPRILPPMLSLHPVPLNPLVPKLMTRNCHQAPKFPWLSDSCTSII